MLKVVLCLAARSKKDDKILLRQRVEHRHLTEAVIIDGQSFFARVINVSSDVVFY
jgi:hypothetical protein